MRGQLLKPVPPTLHVLACRVAGLAAAAAVPAGECLLGQQARWWLAAGTELAATGAAMTNIDKAASRAKPKAGAAPGASGGAPGADAGSANLAPKGL